MKALTLKEFDIVEDIYKGAETQQISTQDIQRLKAIFGKPLNVDGLLFTINKFIEDGQQIALLNVWTRLPRKNNKKERWKFGVYSPADSKLYWFFDGAMASNERDKAIKGYGALIGHVNEHYPDKDYTVFAYKDVF